MKKVFSFAMTIILCVWLFGTTGCFKYVSEEEKILSEVISHYEEYKDELDKTGYSFELKVVPGSHPDELRLFEKNNVVYIFSENGCRNVTKTITDDSTGITDYVDMLLPYDNYKCLTVKYRRFRDHQQETQKTLDRLTCYYYPPDFSTAIYPYGTIDKDVLEEGDEKMKQLISEDEIRFYYQKSNSIFEAIKGIVKDN